MNCPKCDADVGDTYEGDDPSCGIIAGWYCDACDLGIGEHDYPREPLGGDVDIPPRDSAAPLGTPISQLSGRHGHDGYAEFCRIARSWGFP